MGNIHHPPHWYPEVHDYKLGAVTQGRGMAAAVTPGPTEGRRSVWPQHRPGVGRAGCSVPTSCVKRINEALEGWQRGVNHGGRTEGAVCSHLNIHLRLGPDVPGASAGVRDLSRQVLCANAVVTLPDPPLPGGLYAPDPDPG